MNVNEELMGPGWRSGFWDRDKELACAECSRLREQLDDRERGFAKLVLLAHERGDEYWQDQLQIVGDFTLAEARAALGVEGEQEKPT